jgi:hypothetical protein
MKRSLFFSGAIALILTLVSHQKLSAQDTSPFWSLAGNSNASSTTSKLGTTNARNLRLFTNNIERMHINYTNGYVGIGTTSPTYRLQVVNTSHAILGTTTGATSVGVWGKSPSFIGVRGDGKYGLYGQGGTYGVYRAGNTYGLYGGGGTYGVYAHGTTGVYGTGGPTGVYGHGSSYGVYGIGPTYGVYGIGHDLFGQATGVYGEGGDGVYGNGYFAGVHGKGIGAVGVVGEGFWGVLGRGDYGVYGEGSQGVYGNSTDTSGNGVFGWAHRAKAYGGRFQSDSSYGVYATIGNSSSYAGYFVGNVYTTGSYLPSDLKLKQNIIDITNAMEIINKLQPKNYEYQQGGNFKLMNLPQGKQYGLIAQDVEQVLPDLVKETEFDTRLPKVPKSPYIKGNSMPIAKVAKQDSATTSEKINFKALNYIELIPIMIKGMQEISVENNELKKANEELKKDNNDLEARLQRLEAIVLNKYKTSADLSSASLEQNTPNPFNSATIIRYHLPQSAGSAKVVITDMSGKMIKSISLSSRGTGEVSLNGGTLAAGSYNYTLWVEGKQIDSKKMVISK